MTQQKVAPLFQVAVIPLPAGAILRFEIGHAIVQRLHGNAYIFLYDEDEETPSNKRFGFMQTRWSIGRR